jgi:hypothetical protein
MTNIMIYVWLVVLNNVCATTTTKPRTQKISKTLLGCRRMRDIDKCDLLIYVIRQGFESSYAQLEHVQTRNSYGTDGMILGDLLVLGGNNL